MNAPQPTQQLRKIAELKAYPRNYKQHPDSQVDEIIKLIHQFGFWRSVIISSDDVILAGHGLTIAAHKMGFDEVPTLQYPFDHTDPRALKILVADNETARAATTDEKLLAELARELDAAGQLEGTAIKLSDLPTAPTDADLDDFFEEVEEAATEADEAAAEDARTITMTFEPERWATIEERIPLALRPVEELFFDALISETEESVIK